MHYTTAAEAVKLIRSNDSVYIQGSTSIPEALVAAMAERGGELEHVTVYSAFAVGAFDAPYCRPEYKESFLVNSLFVANNIRRWLADGYGQTIPAFLGEIPALFRDGTLPLDVALINVSPPDAEGYCSFGVSADLAVSAVECAKTIIAQVNKAMPYSYGDAVIHTSRLAAAVEVDSPLVEVPTAVPSETERKIGSYIAELIPDGATLQIGVGGIPNAVLAALGGHRHLGLHTEAMTDGVLPLLESGVIDNSQKAVMPGVTVASLALGSRRLYDYMDYRKDLVMKDVAWTNDPFRIRQNPKVMAINSAVEVDLTGQVCADSVGMRIISGVGGQHDFMYGGALSEGGKTFIAIPSTTPKGESKIRALLSPGAGVVTTRHMVQHVVTEYGVAHLRGRNLAERARALIAVAHPSVREELERAAAEKGLTYVRLGGSIGTLVNGAGLAMATMDAIKQAGAESANFLDAGGGASEETVAAAFAIMFSDPHVRGVLINIFGGILRCDVVAHGIVNAARKLDVTVPLVVRLEGTNVEAGRSILHESGLQFYTASSMPEAARLIAHLTAETQREVCA